jgi:nucleoside phosphorylase
MRKTKGSQQNPYIAVVATAIPAETEAVRRLLVYSKTRTLTDGMQVLHGILRLPSSNWKIHLIEVGQGNPLTGARVRTAIHEIKPGYFLFLGVAGGLKDADLGDVVVADRVYFYEGAKEEEKKGARPKVEELRGLLVSTARGMAKESYVARSWPGRDETEGDAYEVFMGPIASGEKIVASLNAETYKLLKTHYNDAQAVETEGYGFVVALKDYPCIHPLLARGVSDKLTNKGASDKAGFQEIAARNVSDFGARCLAKVVSQNSQAARPNAIWIQMDLRLDAPSASQITPAIIGSILRNYDSEVGMPSVRHKGRSCKTDVLISRGGLSRLRRSLLKSSWMSGARVHSIREMESGDVCWTGKSN